MFTFDNIFASIDLIDELIKQYSTVVIEFIDIDRLFRQAIVRYVENKLYINKDLIKYYILVLNWYSASLNDMGYVDLSTPYQITQYQAIAYQLI